MRVDEFLTSLQKSKVTVVAENGEVKVRGHKESLTTDVIETIKSRKQEILDFLADRNAWQSTAIPQQNRKEYYVLSSAQKRLYFLQMLDKNSLAYNLPQIVRISGHLDVHKLEHAFITLINRHDSLRTSFEVINADVRQRVHTENIAAPIEYYSSTEDGVQLIINAFIRSFDLGRAPLVRVGLIKIEPHEHVLLVDMHHIISDGTSQAVMVKEFMSLYNGDELPQLRLQFRDYAEWEQSPEQQARIATQKNFWISQFQEELQVAALPVDFERPSVRSFEGNSVTFDISAEETKALKEIAEKEGATLFMVTLSLYAILLSKLSNQDDIVIGIPISGHQHQEMENTIGMLVNTLPVRSRLKSNLQYTSVLRSVLSNVIGLFENQSYPYEELINALKIERDLSRNPLFDTLFAFQNYEDTELAISGLTVRPYEHTPSPAKFDISLVANETNGKLHFKIDYWTKLFRKETIERFIGYFKKIVLAVVYNPAVKIGDIELVSEIEKRRIINVFNDTQTPYPATATITSMFKKQAALSPGSMAVSFGEFSLTYQELEILSNKVASYLIKTAGVNQGDRVAIMLEREEYLIPCIFGILAAGGVYVPIDPQHPADRINSIVEDASPKAIITRGDFAILTSSGALVIDLNVVLNDILALASSHECACKGSDLAYIIYTSGSTGKPKGVMIEHHSVVNRLLWMQKQYPITAQDVLIQKTPLVFDVSVWELFWWSFAGASLRLLEPGAEKDPHEIIRVIKEHNISVIHFVPSMLGSFLSVIDQAGFSYDDLKSIRLVFASGEALKKEHVTQFGKTVHLNCGSRLINLYGPTEATVDVSYYECDFNEQRTCVPIGKPIDNISLYILDGNQHLLPVGIPGELCIAGVGVARGYLNNKTLTDQKFILHPEIPGQRIYKTGDMAKWLPDGNIEFLGRIDNQVKIRGYRIELSEIESHLLDHPLIANAVVIAKNSGNDSYLLAYYVAAKEIEPELLRAHLAAKVPAYMVPKHFIFLVEIPLTSNGKLNRKSLPDVGLVEGKEYVEPSGKTEQQLAEIWGDVLGIDNRKISAYDIFSELGGHSLKILQMLNRIYTQFDVWVPVKEVFNHPDLQSLSSYIRQLRKTTYVSIPSVTPTDHYVLSSAQKRLFFLNEFDKSSVAYNGGMVVELEGDLDVDRLDSAFQKLISRHEVLRTSFIIAGGEPRQKIASAVPFSIQLLNGDSHDVEKMIRNFQRPFNLENPPLMRAGLISTSSKKHILIIDIHHIISDGMSQNTLVREFMALYKDEKLPDLRIHYKDFACWQQDIEQQKRNLSQKEFWLKEFSDEIQPVQLPLDFARPPVKGSEGDTITFSIDTEKIDGLRKIAEQERATMFTVILSLFNILLNKLANQEDIIVGTVVAGRQHPDIERMPGMFVNTLALRNVAKSNITFAEFLSSVKIKTLICFDHQDYPYEDIVDDLHLERDTSHNPLFDILFLYHNHKEISLEIPGLNVREMSLTTGFSKFDLSLLVHDNDGELKFSLEYSTDLFRKSTIERFARYFSNIISTVVESPQIKIGDIEIISNIERRQLLYDFNNTFLPFNTKRNIPSIFEERVAEIGNATAIVSKDGQLSYRELNERSNQIAIRLTELGVCPGDIIGILLPRTHALIAGIISVLKAGCAYVPIDPDYPKKRIKFIAEDSGLKIFLCEPSLRYILDEIDLPIESIDVTTEPRSFDNIENPAVNIPSSNLAYMIYTSGSTGNPKGVMISHRNVINFMEGITQRISFDPGGVILCLTTVSFDIFFLESIVPLLRGMKIVLADSSEQHDPHLLAALIHTQYVEYLQITPSHLKLLLANCNGALTDIKILMVGGEAFPPDLLILLKAHYKGRIYNMYGPTESTVWSTVKDLTDAVSVTVGTPLSNTFVRVVDKNKKLLPIGVVGELCIGGEGVAKGYWKNEELTRQKFIDDPIASQGTIYLTGDLAKWLPDGSIDVIGRADSQIKIRGFRIELGEIENHLIKVDGVREAAVVVKELSDEKVLVAYFVAENVIERSTLHEFLSHSLPAYMIPSHYVQLQAMPLTPNGKLNRKVLPDPQVETITAFQAPETENEKMLATIWSEVLGVKSVSVTDNFFSIGGDSIKSIQVCSRVRSAGYDLSVKDVFRHRTIRNIAQGLQKSVRTHHDDIAAKARARDILTSEQISRLRTRYDFEDFYPLSPMQEGMLFHSIHSSDPASYFGQTTCQLKGELDIKAIESSMNELISRYDILRTVFVYEGFERHLQVVLKTREIDFTFRDIRQECLNGAQQELIREYQIAERSRPFDLSRDSLMRLAVLQTAGDEYEFIWSHHHVLMDGWCMGIIVNEFREIYTRTVRNEPLSLPAVTPFSSYIQWLEQKQKREKETSAAYWKEYLASYETLAGIPQKEKSRQGTGYELETIVTILDEAEINLIRKVCARCEITVNTLFQCAWALLLSRYNNVDDVVFGSVVSGRPSEIAGIETMVGLFINTVPVRVQFEAGETVASVLQRAQQRAIESVAHHYHPLAEIQSLSELGNGLLNHILTFQNLPTPQLDETHQPFKIGKADLFIQTNYDLSITVFPSNQFETRFDFNACIYGEDTIQRVASYFKNIVRAMVRNTSKEIANISLYTHMEQATMISRFRKNLKVPAADVTIQERLKNSFERHPLCCAIEYRGKKITYAELEKASDKIAANISQHGVLPGSFIGIRCEDRVKMIYSMLGILKSGNAFVPLETSLPNARLSEMICQAGIEYCITDQQPETTIKTAQAKAIHWLSIDIIDEQKELTHLIHGAVYSQEDPIYVYFTSGSTGTPKGVVGRNTALSHFVDWEIKTFDIDETFRFSQLTNPGFDAFMRDIFVPLCAGGTICIPEQQILSSVQEINNWITSQGINLIHCVPSFFKFLQKDGMRPEFYPQLKYVLLAGEKILPYELRKWYNVFGDRIQLVNLYGATETSLVKAYHLIQPAEVNRNFIPVKAMEGAQLLVLDAAMQDCPHGATGDIYIRTPYRTAGYLIKDSKVDNFTPNPYSDDNQDLLYKTGDIGRECMTGEIEVLGRKDHQVKVMGIRIELDDIKENLLRFDGIRDALVTAIQNDSDNDSEKLLCAYIVPARKYNEDELRKYLTAILPPYMLPAYFVPIPNFPLLPNGKINTKALPAPGVSKAQEHTFPSNEIETRLVDLWSETLKIDKATISTSKSFFEMGGHSLKLLLFMNKINKHYSVKVPIQQLFAKPTIQKLGEYVSTLKQLEHESKTTTETIEIAL